MDLPPVDGSSFPPGKPPGRKKEKPAKKSGGRTVSPAAPDTRTSANPKKKKSQRSRKTIQQYHEKKLFDALGVATGPLARSIYDLALEKIEKYAIQHGESTLIHYLKAAALCETKQLEAALVHAEAFFKETRSSGDAELYSLACYWLGKIKLQTEDCLREEILELFKTAYEHNIPIAGKLIMRAHLGTDSNLSLIKWCNPLRALDIAQELPELFSQHSDKLLSLSGRYKNDPLKTMYVDMRLQTETANLPDKSNLSQLFITQLIDMFHSEISLLPELSQQMENTFARFHEKYGDNIIIMALYHRALLAIKDHNPESINFLSENPFPLCQLLAGDYYRTSDTPQHALKYYKQSFDMIHGYRLVAEHFLQENRISDALIAYKDGIRRLQDFLGGDTKLFHLFPDEQLLKLAEANYSQEHLMEIAYEEQYAIHEYIHLFQGQIDLLEETIDELISSETVPVLRTPAQSQPAAESDSDDEYFDASETIDKLSPSPTPSTDSDEYQEAFETLDESNFIPIGFFGKRKARRKLPPSEKRPEEQAIKHQIAEAVQRAEKKHQFDSAIRRLEALKKPKGTLLWFIQQQALNWVRRSRGMHMIKEPEQNAREGHDLLLKTEQETIQLIRLLAKKTEDKSSPKGSAGETLLANTPENCLAIAGKLEAIDPKLRKQYGGLYSLLGHLQKSLRQSPHKSESKGVYYQRGVHYYTLANHIRNRPAS